jgi:predicted NAD-dependent protein-ADP-ribosyltransferase YbiA (DUF1768 family)
MNGLTGWDFYPSGLCTRAAKALGRQVRYFNNEVWLGHRFELVVRASLAKFRQNPHLRSFLLGTQKREELSRAVPEQASQNPQQNPQHSL